MGVPSRHSIYSEFYQQQAKGYRDYLLLLGYAKETCQARYLYLKEFFSWLEEIGIYHLQAVTATETTNFYEYIQNRESNRTGQLLKRKTVYDIMRCVQVYLGYALHLGTIRTNPASHLKFPYPDERAQRMIFSQEEIRALYRACETPQERVLLHMGYGCGLRVHEISQLGKEDLRLTENLIIVQKGKNSKRRLVPVNETVSRELQEFILLSEVKQKAVLLNSKGTRMQPWTLNSTLKSTIRRTGFGRRLTPEELNKIGIHTLRHSIATHLLENGMKLQQVQLFLGHSHIESTEIYTHVNQNQINRLMQ